MKMVAIQVKVRLSLPLVWPFMIDGFTHARTDRVEGTAAALGVGVGVEVGAGVGVGVEVG